MTDKKSSSLDLQKICDRAFVTCLVRSSFGADNGCFHFKCFVITYPNDAVDNETFRMEIRASSAPSAIPV